MCWLVYEQFWSIRTYKQPFVSDHNKSPTPSKSGCKLCVNMFESNSLNVQTVFCGALALL